jgi:hypothetical protein
MATAPVALRERPTQALPFEERIAALRKRLEPAPILDAPNLETLPSGFSWGFLAVEDCTRYLGSGLRIGGHRPQREICKCVYRAVFVRCLRMWRESRALIDQAACKTHCHMFSGRCSVGMRQVEYLADFELVARRSLEGPASVLLFELHFLRGLEWHECLPIMNRKLRPQKLFDRGWFFHEVYRIEEQLGKVYVELIPHALFPLDSYFARPAAATEKFNPAENWIPRMRWSAAEVEEVERG